MRLDQMDLEKLGRMADLAVDDPERERFEASPDNAALLLAYHRFLSAPHVDGARPDDAEAEMRKFVASQTTSQVTAEAPGFFAWLNQFMRPGVLAPAAFVVMIAVGATLWQTRQPESTLLRDMNGAASLVLDAPELLPDGSLRVSWEQFDGADGYDIRFLAADLEELDRVESVPGMEMIVSPSTVAEFEEIRFWQLIGLAGGDELLRSRIETLK